MSDTAMPGIDLLGGQLYVDAATGAYKSLQGYAAGLFWNCATLAVPFTSAKPLITGLLSAGCKTFRVHLLWGGESHTYSNRENDAMTAFSGCMQAFMGKVATVYISPYCEHNLSTPTMQALFAKINSRSKGIDLKTCPKPKFVNTPFKNGGLVTSFRDAETNASVEVLNEIHIPSGTSENASSLPDPRTGKYTVSPDGWLLGLRDKGAKNYNAKYGSAVIRFAWDVTLNPHTAARPTAAQIVTLGKLLKKYS